MKIVIIQGGGATGKSTLAKELEKTFKIPIFSKDDYRMTKYKFKKTSFIDWFRIERQSYDATYNAINAAIKEEKSLIVEGNFFVLHRRKFRKALSGNTNVIEIDCYTKGFIAARRYIIRNWKDGVDDGLRDYIRYVIVSFEAICSMLGMGWYKGLGLSKNTLRLDTSDPDGIDYKPILDLIKSIN